MILIYVDVLGEVCVCIIIIFNGCWVCECDWILKNDGGELELLVVLVVAFKGSWRWMFGDCGCWCGVLLVALDMVVGEGLGGGGGLWCWMVVCVG